MAWRNYRDRSSAGRQEAWKQSGHLHRTLKYQLLPTKDICAGRACSREALAICRRALGIATTNLQKHRSVCHLYIHKAPNLVCAGLPPHSPRCAHTPGRSARCPSRAGDVDALRVGSHGCARWPSRRLRNVCGAAGWRGTASVIPGLNLLEPGLKPPRFFSDLFLLRQNTHCTWQGLHLCLTWANNHTNRNIHMYKYLQTESLHQKQNMINEVLLLVSPASICIVQMHKRPCLEIKTNDMTYGDYILDWSLHKKEM